LEQHLNFSKGNFVEVDLHLPADVFAIDTAHCSAW
jgi:hypothetical protein